MQKGQVVRAKTSDLIWQETQHQRLFELLDELESGLDLQRALQFLRHYAEEHFALEEAYMEAVKFPGRDAHVRAHDKFREQFRELEPTTGEEDEERQIIAMFLREWLSRHIYGTDKILEAFILSTELR